MRPVKMFMYKIFLGIVLLVVLPQIGFASDYKKGLAEYQAGNFAKAYCIWENLAQNNHVVAQYSIGWMYANGEGLAVDAEEAVKWWEKSAKLGHPDAHFALALAYTTGEGVQQDRTKAIKWHLEASQLGHEDSQSILYDMVVSKFGELEVEEQRLLKSAWRILGTSNTTKSKYTNVLYQPKKGAKIQTVIAKGNEVVEFQRKGEWVQIGIPKQLKVGWVHESNLR